MSANSENSAVTTELEKVSFHYDSKEVNIKEYSNYCTIVLISHVSKIMLKILQARLLQHKNHELPDVQAQLRKDRGTRDQIGNIHWIIENASKFCFIDYTEVFDCVDHKKLWKILEEIRMADHPTYLLRNLYAGQEATIRSRHGTMD